MEWLEQPNMEGIMQTSAWRQGQSIRDVANLLEHLIGLEIFGSQLATALYLERGEPRLVRMPVVPAVPAHIPL